ncbi:MAG TPA: tetratricopeptide repeat protein [Candidatus Brocadiia bacterium]|nr:tetratricopeptide repeat protein [Candidatus Brocadiia bacterium]
MSETETAPEAQEPEVQEPEVQEPEARGPAAEASETEPWPRKAGRFLAPLALAVIVMVVFRPAAEIGWVMPGDAEALAHNEPAGGKGPEVAPEASPAASPQATPKAETLSRSRSGYYTPVLWMAVEAFRGERGVNPMELRKFALALHAFNAVLCFLFFRKLGASYRGAFVGALLWAVHPLRVEPVVWLTQLRLLLGAFFCLVSGLFFLEYRRISDNRATAIAGLVGRTVCYTLSALAFLLAVGAMPAAAAWPLMLLAAGTYAVLRRGSGAPDAEKPSFGKALGIALRPVIPMLAISLIGAIVFMRAQADSGNALAGGIGQLPRNLLAGCYSLGFHLGRIVIPDKLGFAYRLPDPISVAKTPYILALVGILVLAWVFRLSLKEESALAMGIAFYVAGMLPYCQILPVAHPLGDRHTYLASLGLMAAVAVESGRLFGRLKRNAAAVDYLRAAVAPVLAAVLIMTGTGPRLDEWRSPLGLWTAELRREPGNAHAWAEMSKACHNIAEALAARRDVRNAGVMIQRAEAAVEKAVSLEPGNAEYRLAAAAHKLKRAEGLGAAAESATPKEPDAAPGATRDPRKFAARQYPKAELVRKFLAEHDKLLEEIKQNLDTVLKTDPGNRRAGFMMLKWLLMKGDTGGAEAALAKLMESPEPSPAGFQAMGAEFLKLKRYEAALKCFDRAIKESPGDMASRYGLAECQMKLGQAKEARETLIPFLEKHPGSIEALSLSARASWAVGDKDGARMREAKIEEAIVNCDAVLAKQPGSVQAMLTAAKACRALGKDAKAAEYEDRARKVMTLVYEAALREKAKKQAGSQPPPPHELPGMPVPEQGNEGDMTTPPSPEQEQPQLELPKIE